MVDKSLAPEKVKRAFRSLDEPDDLRRALRIYSVFQEEEKQRLLSPGVRVESNVAEPIEKFHREAAHLPPLGRMLYTDTRTWLVDDLLLVYLGQSSGSRAPEPGRRNPALDVLDLWDYLGDFA